MYLQMQWQDDEIHWFSIVNSSVILLFLSGMVAMIMLRILRKDLYRYNQLEQSEEAREEAREETGWKLVYGDVFRPPKQASLLAVFIGSGVQVLAVIDDDDDAAADNDDDVLLLLMMMILIITRC